ncbi:MAG: C1 family peptidase [Ignavibacteriaceae bacterium]
MIIRYTIKLFFFSIFITQTIAYSQEYGRGVLLNDSLYANSPVAAPLMRGDYNDVPSKYSLKEYAPTPGYQGSYGTCAGWCTAYAARTILEAIKSGWNHSTIDSNAFSPSFVYNQIRYGKGCNEGTSIMDALDILKDMGCEKLTDFSYDCDREVSENDKLHAEEYKIIEYREVANSRTDNKSMYVKKSISNDRPVAIAMNCPESFDNAKEVWNPDSSDYNSHLMAGHGIAVIGYDDNKFGGAFELINSWGTNWGKKGFTWMRYSDFQKFCVFAFEVLNKPNDPSNTPDLTGSLKFTESSGKEMKAAFNGEYFVMQNSYPAETLFELRISNNEPAYVYALGSDNSCRVTKIFPFNEKMLAYLPYKKNDIAIPDEDHYNMIDTAAGPTYYCFLYSKKSLDISDIMKKIESGTGNFEERLNDAVKDIQVDNNNIKFSDGDEIKFNAKSRGKIVVPVLVEIPKPLNK